MSKNATLARVAPSLWAATASAGVIDPSTTTSSPSEMS